MLVFWSVSRLFYILSVLYLSHTGGYRRPKVPNGHVMDSRPVHEFAIRRINGGGFELENKRNREALKAGRHHSFQMSSLSRASRLCTQCLSKNGLLRPVATTLGRPLVYPLAYKHSLEKRSLPPWVQNTIRSSRLLSTSVSRLKPSASSVDKRTVNMGEFPPERIR